MIIVNSVTIKTKLDVNFLKREELKEFLGKEVKIVISEVDKVKRNNQKLAKTGGCWDLEGRLDDVNIRDFAYE